MDAGTQLSSAFIRFRAPAHGMVLPTLKVGHPIQHTAPKQAWRFVCSGMTLGPVELAISINHHIWRQENDRSRYRAQTSGVRIISGNYWEPTVSQGFTAVAGDQSCLVTGKAWVRLSEVGHVLPSSLAVHLLPRLVQTKKSGKPPTSQLSLTDGEKFFAGGGTKIHLYEVRLLIGANHTPSPLSSCPDQAISKMLAN